MGPGTAAAMGKRTAIWRFMHRRMCRLPRILGWEEQPEVCPVVPGLYVGILSFKVLPKLAHGNAWEGDVTRMVSRCSK